MQSNTRFTLAGVGLICIFGGLTGRAMSQTGSADNMDDYANAYMNVQPPNGGIDWFWVADPNTSCCILTSDTSSYTVPPPIGSPTIDGESRIFYVDWKANTLNGNPGERYSTAFGNAENATHFVYDVYIYVKDPQNIQNIEMDTNQVWDNNGDVLIYELQCANGPQSWKSTESNLNAQIPQPKRVTPNQNWQTHLACDPQTWTANAWHHVQLSVHRDSTGAAFYDSITFDGTTTALSGWSGNSSFPRAWSPVGNLLLNFQLDGIYNNGAEATITAYIDKLNLSWH